MNKFNFILGIILLLMILNPLVNAMGISSDYTSDNPITVSPGETKTVNMLQLLYGSTDTEPEIKIKVELIEDKGVASLVGDSVHTITPTGPSIISVKLSIPLDAKDNTNYPIKFRFTDLTPSENEGMISFSRTSSITVPVYVKKDIIVPTKTNTDLITTQPSKDIAWIVYIILGLISLLILFIIYLIFYGKKKYTLREGK